MAAFAHLPVLIDKAPGIFIENPGGAYVDATFGRGGHSRAFLSLLNPDGRLIAFDRDEAAVDAAKGIADPRFCIYHAPFSAMAGILTGAGSAPVDGIFMDIGVSSPQIDDPQRGFSFSKDGPLDMRMDQSRGQTAADFVNRAPEREIARVIREFGEEKYAFRIARTIAARRVSEPFLRTLDLARTVSEVVPVNRADPSQNRAARTFQAIRIHINGELDELMSALRESLSLLKPGGQIAVITFHSLEDRMVKRFFAEASHPERDFDPRIPLTAGELPKPLLEDVRRVFPDDAEKASNPRSRSATLRVARRTAEAARGAEGRP